MLPVTKLQTMIQGLIIPMLKNILIFGGTKDGHYFESVNKQTNM